MQDLGADHEPRTSNGARWAASGRAASASSASRPWRREHGFGASLSAARQSRGVTCRQFALVKEATMHWNGAN